MELRCTITETIDRQGQRTYIELKDRDDFVTITVPTAKSEFFRKGEAVLIQTQGQLPRSLNISKKIETFLEMASRPRRIRLGVLPD